MGKHEEIFNGTLTEWYLGVANSQGYQTVKVVLRNGVVFILVRGERDALGLSSPHISPQGERDGNDG